MLPIAGGLSRSLWVKPVPILNLTPSGFSTNIEPIMSTNRPFPGKCLMTTASAS